MTRSDLESIEDPRQLDTIEFIVWALAFLAQFCPVFQLRRYIRLNGQWWSKAEPERRK